MKSRYKTFKSSKFDVCFSYLKHIFIWITIFKLLNRHIWLLDTVSHTVLNYTQKLLVLKSQNEYTSIESISEI